MSGDIGDSPTSGGEEDLIARARRQMEGVPPGEESLATLPGMPPPDSFPGYDVVREIHHGGQGAVYLAIQRTTRRKVAVKVMHGGPHIGSSGRARFEREVQILGQLNHPNIVRIMDSGVTPDGGFFYVMDYISGRTLDEHIGATKPGIQEVLSLFIRICEGVNAAHLRGVIHRDLKPANVRVDQRGEPIIVDFGLAKIAVPEATPESPAHLMSMTGQFIGSLPWASPEQAEGSPGAIDVRTDVYSLGVMLYQMLTGRFPYDVVGNMRDVLNNILKATPARPSTVRRQINAEVETIVLKCLSKERDRRYQSAGDVARDLTRYLRGEPIEAKRDSGWYVITKTLRRYRPQVAAVATIAVLVVAFGVISAVLYQKQKTATREAVAQRGVANAEAARARAAEKTAADRGEALASELKKKSTLLAFMDDVFKAATPEQAQGRDVTVVEAVDAAASAVEPSLGSDEELAAEMHHAIGQVYLRLSKPEKAAPHLEQAEALRRKRLGAVHRDTLEAAGDVALAYRNQQLFARAEPKLREVVRELSESADFGPSHERTLETRINLARCLDEQNDPAKRAEAEEIYRSLIAAYRERPGQERYLIACLAHCGNLLIQLKRPVEARPLIREAVTLMDAHPDPSQGRLYGRTRVAHARLLEALSAPADETESAYRVAVVHYSDLMGETNRETMSVRSLLAAFLRQQNRLEESLAEWGGLVEDVHGGAVPASDPLVSQFEGRYGECLLAMNRLDEAEPILITSHDAFVQRDPRGRGAQLARERLRDLYTRKGQPEKAALYTEPPGG